MSFLIWDNESECQQSLDGINAGYGCPYELDNGYKMDQWATLTKSIVDELWGFISPQDRPGSAEEGVSADALMLGLEGSPIIEDKRPSDWTEEEDDS